MMSNNENFLDINPESASIQTHRSIIQNVVQRMATNSSSCKAWCITLVSAILVIVADQDKPSYAWITLLPTLLFAALDAYYLGLEKGFRNAYDKFIYKLHRHELTETDLYSVKPVGSISKLQMESLKSFSIWGFYVSLIVLIALTRFVAIA